MTTGGPLRDQPDIGRRGHPAARGAGELVFRDCDFAAGAGAVRMTVSATGGPYDYVTLDAATALSGVQEFRAELHGPLRLSHLDFHPA